MMLSTAEDTILQKLRWYKRGKIEKHLIDAAFVFQTQQRNLDMKYLNSWATKLNVQKNLRLLGHLDLEDYV